MKTYSNMERRIGGFLQRHRVTGLLSAVLLASPFTGLGQGEIATDVHTGINLNTVFNPNLVDTVIVRPSVVVDNSNSGNDAIYGDTISWTIVNSANATLNGVFSGVNLQNGGTVTNLSGASIAGGNSDALHIQGGSGKVENFGTITAGAPNGDDGVDLDNGGSVANHVGASIYGYDDGISTHGSVDVNNAGSIRGENDDGVNLHEGGSVVNQTTGTIYGGDNGIEIQTGVINSDLDIEDFTVLNYGSVTGNGNNGVIIDGGGRVINYDGATITGHENGINIEYGTGNVFNTNGTIIGECRDGVTLNSGGEVYNTGANAVIAGKKYGVEISGGYGTVYNYNGLISGGWRDGVRLREGGEVYNFAGDEGESEPGIALIAGHKDGVHISGGPGTVENGGTIWGTNRDGVRFDDGGTVYNYQGGTIEGGRYGVEISGGTLKPGMTKSSDLVNNYGSIVGESRSGVRLRDGGSVYNYYNYDENENPIGPATIYGYHDGVHIDGGEGYVYNAGTITGEYDNGIQMDSYGTVDNYGTIEGSLNSAEPIVLTEITGNGDGVQMHSGGTVNNYGGSITGGDDGVYIEGGSGYVENYASITGQNDDGVRLKDGGSVYNYGSIWGSDKGVHISGGGYLYNAGTIGSVDGSVAIKFDDSPAVMDESLVSDDDDDSSPDNTLVLDTGSEINGNIVGSCGIDAVILNGYGSEDNNFYKFETLVMNGASYGGGWDLTGCNTFSTSVTVEAGLLRINGKLITPILTVLPYGILGGDGPITSSVDIQGTVAPGNSIGTLLVNGSFNFGSNSVYEAEVDSEGNGDQVLVEGDPATATIEGGWVNPITYYGVYGDMTEYVILNATNGVTGEFDGVEDHWLFLDPSLLYPDTNTVVLRLDRVAFSSVARTYNQRGVTKGLDSAVAHPGDLSDLLATFFQLGPEDDATARKWLDSLSGEIHGTAGMLAAQQNDTFVHSISLRTGRISSSGDNGGYAANNRVQLAANGTAMLPAPEADKTWDIWAQGAGSFGDVSGDGNAASANYTIAGFDGGIDYRVSPEMLLGLAVGYSHNDVSGSRHATAKVDDIQFAGYGGYVSGPWHFDGIASVGLLSTDTKRTLFTGQTAKANYDGSIFGFSAEGGYAIMAGPVTIQPTLGVNYTHLSQDSFKEKGAGANGLKVRSVDMDSFQSSLGVRLAARLGKEGGVQFVPALRVAWEHEFADQTAMVTERFIGAGNTFHVRGVELGTESATIGAGLTVEFSQMVQAFVNYDARLNEQLTSQSVSGGLSIAW